MRRWNWMILVLLMSAALTGCGKEPTEEPEAPAPIEEEQPEEATGTSPEEPKIEDILLYAQDVELGADASGRLELYGQHFDENDWGIKFVTWTPAGREDPACTFYVQDALEAYLGKEYLGENESYTGAWRADGGLRLEDINFDGYLDIGLQAYKTSYNAPCIHWTYDPVGDRFDYAFGTNMLGAADPEKKILICFPRSGAADHYTEYYAYDENGALYLAHRNTLRFEGETEKSFNEYFDGPALTPLTEEELAEFTSFFNTPEHNGLLRFPYQDSSEVWSYLDVLFYDDSGSAAEMTPEEFAAAEAAGVFTELDMRKLTTDHILEYLQKNFGIEMEEAEKLLTQAGEKLGTYLPEYDAWYSCRGDTGMQQYTFTDGCRFLDGSVQLYYTAGALYCNESQSENTVRFDVPMHVQLRLDGGGSWYVTRNMMDGSY